MRGLIAATDSDQGQGVRQGGFYQEERGVGGTGGLPNGRERDHYQGEEQTRHRYQQAQEGEVAPAKSVGDAGGRD